ncbi:MAG: DUF4241 domain-containing protein [Erysipelotrichaceae bacterium]|nr:DUF4241 domain-containing protein [Erysipelotrichaceae bacterium]
MALFDFLRKKKEEPVQEEQEKGPWELAYQAQPAVYQSPEGNMMMSFTLTEDTETILPMDPQHMFRVKGNVITDIRLALCSLQENGIIAVLPYYGSIQALSDYVQDSRGQYVLLRGLSHDELQKLAQDVSEAGKRQTVLQNALARNLEFLARDETDPDTVQQVFAGDKVQTFTFEDVRFPTGTLLCADPFCTLVDDDELTLLEETIPAGSYPIHLAIVHPPGDSVRIAGMKLSVSDAAAVSYEPAETWYMRNGMRKEGLMGFAVEAGLACFADEKAAEAARQFFRKWREEHPGVNFYNEYFAPLFRESHDAYPDLQREEGDFIRWQIPESEEEIVISATGYGDGYYSTYCGYDSQDKLCEIVVMFMDPQLFGENEDEES